MEFTQAIKNHGIEMEMTERGAYILAHQADLARRAVKEIKAQVDRLNEVLAGDDAEVQLIELRRFAGHVGYSNSIGTAWSELSAAAGAVGALLEAF